jgi:hypothetical protein
MDMTHQEAEEKIIKQAKQFQRMRGYLVKKFERGNEIKVGSGFCNPNEFE